MSFTIRRVSEEKEPSKWKTLLLQALAILPTVLKMAFRAEERKVEKALENKREKRLKRTITFLVAGLCVLLLLIGMLKVMVRLKALALGMVSMVGAELPTDAHGYTNILLLGTGDADHDGIDLTDTIMVASLDPANTKSAVLVSIPRDTYLLDTEKMGKGRVNSLYRDYKIALIRDGMDKGTASLQALKELGKEVGSLVGLPIHGVVKVDFTAFEQAIDLIGGIDVLVPEDIVDPEYPGPDYTYQTFSIAAGPQHLDGATALKYARSRHSTSDFSRSARQQQIIAAAGKKVKENGLIKNAGKISDILGIAAKNVESTLGAREFIGLAVNGQ
jgi:LCP family protein required for cell wall assembly